MAAAGSMTAAPPRRLLLASDLSARCDRALDRGAQLAGAWRAELLVLNVAAAPQAPDLALAWAAGGGDAAAQQHAARQLQADVAALDVPVQLRVRRGDVADAIRNEAASSGSGLVIAGMARDEPFGRFLVGSTVHKLARTLASPLLVVRRRCRGPYRRVLVATDFSAASLRALQLALHWFPAVALTLYHARPPRGSEVETAATVERAHDALRRGACAAFLAGGGLDAAQRGRLQIVIDSGPLEVALTRHVRADGVELVLMGARGRGGLRDLLLGSSAARLLDWLPCDTLVVRESSDRPIKDRPPR